MKRWKNPRTQKHLQDLYSSVPKTPPTDMYTTTPLARDNLVHSLMPNRQTQIMSILNTTPDSFSDGGSNALDLQSLRETAAAHIAAGATIIDVGGQSSRPNAPDVTAEEEINRVLPAIAAIKSLPEAKGIAISVDTYRAAVAEAAVNAGADIVNDISAGKMDSQMLQTVARLGCTYVMMHMRGTPATMQNPENCEYAGGLFDDISKELLERVDDAVKTGVRKWRLILDPGIGFAKTQEQNLALLHVHRNLFNRNKFRLRTRGMPWLVGCSRKGFIGKITGVTEPKDRAWGTAVAVTASIKGGADIVRVHDVKEMAQVVKMADALYRCECTPDGTPKFVDRMNVKSDSAN
jgi:dihydropteroate synthase